MKQASEQRVGSLNLAWMKRWEDRFQSLMLINNINSRMSACKIGRHPALSTYLEKTSHHPCGAWPRMLPKPWSSIILAVKQKPRIFSNFLTQKKRLDPLDLAHLSNHQDSKLAMSVRKALSVAAPWRVRCSKVPPSLAKAASCGEGRPWSLESWADALLKMAFLRFGWAKGVPFNTRDWGWKETVKQQHTGRVISKLG